MLYDAIINYFPFDVFKSDTINTRNGHLKLKTYGKLPNLSVSQGSKACSRALHPHL
jgi:hypothetical protein